ncbi:MAG: UPF0182 family protein [Chloroflexi bacterium]|nr:MAG: UPF0182 family protein [Chloroflexota bacterium]
MRRDDPFADLIRSLEEGLEREGGIGPPQQPPRTPRPPVAGEINPRRYLWIIIPLLIFLFFNRIVSFYADWFWYDSLELASVFFTRIWASLGLFAVGALVAFLFFAANVLIARRLEPFGLTNTVVDQIAFATGARMMTLVLVAGAFFALLMGAGASGRWEELLLYLNQRDFGLADPIFQQDISFFLFTLPVWQVVRGWLLMVTFVTLLASAVVAGVGIRGWSVSKPVLIHLAILAALVLALMAWGYRISAYELLYSRRGATFGAGYTDVHAQLPVYNLLMVVTFVAAASLLVAAVLRRGWRTIVVVLAAWAILAVVAGSLYPSIIQRFQVAPNELTLETEYIGHNIRYTRAAFDLDRIEIQPYVGNQPLTAETLRQGRDTVLNIRLWDYRPLLQTYNQVQALTQYYEFNDIDVDRYVIDGQLRQVMIAARELVPERLNPEAQTWVNRRLVYTHGYGVAVSPVAQVARDGLPTFLLKDLPPQGLIELTTPQIYFGERTNDYVIARTQQAEFDYSRGDQIVTTNFDAATGIDMRLGARLLFALHFADLNMVLNQDITSDSQLLWRRNIAERVRDVAPFLEFDRDPYIVIGDDGGLYWMHDAYTMSGHFPYSTPLPNGLNYIRNAVKVVTNAYDGSMSFYVADPNDPIIAAYERIFPDLFVPISEMPEDLRRHIRYPNDIFTIQSEVYRLYHMTIPSDFYNREDVWAWPEEIFDDQVVRMEPYYVLMELPDRDGLHFMQILPFTPANRENMTAWLAAHSDPDFYGQKVAYEFGKDTLYFGPKQIEARIDQDGVISAQLALWNQQGSSVIRGNLIIIPLGNSLLYVEPLYLQAATGRIPELRRVVLATGERVIMAPNLGLALGELLGDDVLAEAGLIELAAADGQLPTEGATAAVGDVGLEDAIVDSLEELIIRANSQYNAAQESLRAGDWGAYGEGMLQLQNTLTQLANVAGVAGPAPTPAPDE